MKDGGTAESLKEYLDCIKKANNNLYDKGGKRKVLFYRGAPITYDAMKRNLKKIIGYCPRFGGMIMMSVRYC